MLGLRKNIKSQKGFTLVELLVVIAIIGIMAAIAVPKFSDSTATARTAKVQADLRAIDTAIQMYMANHSGALPTGADDIKTYLTTGALPTAEAGKYRISGTTKTLTSVTYGLNDAKDRAQATFAGDDSGKYTADSLKQ